MGARSPEQEQLAVTLYVCGPEGVRGNMTEAYLQARYCPGGNRSTAKKAAQEFFDRPRVKQAVAQLACKMQTRLVASADKLIEEMDAIIFADPADAFDPVTGEPLPIYKMPRRFRSAIAGWEDGGKKIRLVPKTPVLQLRGETLGMWERLVERQINALPERARIERAAALLAQAFERRLPLPAPAPAETQTIEVEP